MATRASARYNWHRLQSTARLAQCCCYSFLLLLITIQVSRQPTQCDAKAALPPATSSHQRRAPTNRHANNDEDFPPKLTHQPHSVHAQANKPHTVECPVESWPESDVKWFKDGVLLESQPTHLEQSGSELMFFQLNENDEGDYYCLASNYLGSITSEQFRLTIQTSIHDPSVRLEPSSSEAETNQPAEFTCSIPASVGARPNGQQQQRTRLAGGGGAEMVSWRLNGRRLPVIWLTSTSSDDSQEQIASNGKRRFLARQLSASEFVLTITQTQPKDDNATLTCLYRDLADENEMAHESSEAKLRVVAMVKQRAPMADTAAGAAETAVKIDYHMAPPIDNLVDLANPSAVGGRQQQSIKNTNNNSNNHTTQLIDSMPRRVNTLSETLRDLYEIAKPTLIVFGVLFLVGLVVLLQFLIIRRRSHENRYMKHQYSSSGGSAGSGTSSAIGSSLDCDPVISSLLSRTLSAPTAASLSALPTNNKTKYKSYRDHMRKVAAANDLVGNDFIDAAYFNAHMQQHHHQANHQSGDHQPEQPFFTSSALPNLYNQSLAAREQARSLLQASEHMRSLSNLSSQPAMVQNGNNNNSNGKQSQNNALNKQTNNVLRNNGSHLNLPLSFAFGGGDQHQHQQSGQALLENGVSQLMSGALWPAHVNMKFGSRNHHQQQHPQQQFVRQQQHDEHYQLVSCSSSISPSSSSSAGGTNVSASSQTGKDPMEFNQKDAQNNAKTLLATKDSSSLNHYSTIETNEEDETPRYEELDRSSDNTNRCSSRSRVKNQQQDSFRVNNNRTSTFVTHSENNNQNEHQTDFQRNQKSSNNLRSSLISTHSNSSSLAGSESTATTTSISLMGNGLNRLGSARSNLGKTNSKMDNNNNNKTATMRQTGGFQDQLSPYAVSSICNRVPQSVAAPPPPPPVNSEAMRALNEQFDINQLMLLDEPALSSGTGDLPFSSSTPPPPPPPPASSQTEHSDRSQPKRKSKHDH